MRNLKEVLQELKQGITTHFDAHLTLDMIAEATDDSVVTDIVSSQPYSPPLESYSYNLGDLNVQASKKELVVSYNNLPVGNFKGKKVSIFFFNLQKSLQTAYDTYLEQKVRDTTQAS